MKLITQLAAILSLCLSTAAMPTNQLAFNSPDLASSPIPTPDLTLVDSLWGCPTTWTIRCVLDGDWRNPVGNIGVKPFCRVGIRCNQCDEKKNTFVDTPSDRTAGLTIRCTFQSRMQHDFPSRMQRRMRGILSHPVLIASPRPVIDSVATIRISSDAKYNSTCNQIYALHGSGPSNISFPSGQYSSSGTSSGHDE